jgi:hypothetical protein
MDMLTKYGSYKTVWERQKKWSVKGAWKNIMKSWTDKQYDLSVDYTTLAAKKGATVIRR